MQRIPQIVTGGSLLLLQAACPPQPAPTDTDTTADPASTTNGDAGVSSTTAPATTGGTTTTTVTGTTGFGDSTTTDEDPNEEPVVPGCTYPGSTSAGAESSEVDDACACVQGAPICGAELCPIITGTCSYPSYYEDSCPGSWEFADAALHCAIMAAAAGTEGTIEWRFTADGGYSGRNGFMHIVSERRVIRQDTEFEDLGASVSDTELWNLKDPAWFEDCLEFESFCERMDCFFAGTEGAALSLCEEGHERSYY